jgi:CheY-like chemotaxis protein
MKLRILIIDDSDTTRRIIRAIVQSHEWTICGEAESGWDGVAQFDLLKPDLVLIDLAMPDLNGIEVARKISKLDSKVPLILFTVLELEGLQEPARQAGISAVVSKAQAWDLVKVIETTVSSLKTPRQWLQ